MMIRINWHFVFFSLILWQAAVVSSYSKPELEVVDNFSENARDTFKVSNASHFSLIYSSEIIENEKIASLLELSYSYFQLLFENCQFELKEPDEKLKWIIFTDKKSFDYYALSTEKQDLSWLNGYYSAKTNTVAIVSPKKISKWQIQPENTQSLYVIACPPDAETDLAKIVHEAAHHLSFNSGLQKRKVVYPFWVSEGLATFFEQNMCAEYFKSSKYSNIRKERLAGAYSQEKLIPLEEFISMVSLDASISSVDAYAQAWGFFKFLLENHQSSLKKYLSLLYELELGWNDEQTLHNIFIQSFGNQSEMNVEWKQFLEQLSS